MNPANQITYLRLLLIPAVVLSFHSELAYSNLLAAVLFTLASLSDWLDGYLARRYELTSEFGGFLDPVADKLLVVTVLVMLVGENNSLLIPTVVIIAREVLISALREWMAGRGHREAVAVVFSGKLKTTIQMIAIIVLILVTPQAPDWMLMLTGPLLAHWLLMSGYGMIILAAVLSLYSAVHYLRAARPFLSP